MIPRIHPELLHDTELIYPAALSPRYAEVLQVSATGAGRQLLIVGWRADTEVLHSVSVEERRDSVIVAVQVGVYPRRPAEASWLTELLAFAREPWVTRVKLRRPLGLRRVLTPLDPTQVAGRRGLSDPIDHDRERRWSDE